MPSIKATMGLDTTDFSAGLKHAEKAAAGTGSAITNNLSHARSRGFGGATSAMFVSVARDTAASLASGANPVTVLMQQLPQVLQALTMMKYGLMSLLKIALPAAAAIAAAFATHYISKGVAAMVYGLDKIAAKGEQLERTRQILRKLVDQMKEAALIGFGLRAEELKDQESLATAIERQGKAERDLLKAKAEARNLAGMALGNADNQLLIDEEALKLEKEALEAKLEKIRYAMPESAAIKLAEGEVAKLESETPFVERGQAFYDKILAAEQRVKKVAEIEEAKWKAEVAGLEKDIIEKDNAIAKLRLPKEPGKEIAPKGIMDRDLTERQRIGAHIAGPLTLVNINQSINRHVASIDRKMGMRPHGSLGGLDFGGH